MNEIECTIKDFKNIDGKEFIVIQDNFSQEEFSIPLSQSLYPERIKINQTRTFIKEYNTIHGKSFFYLVEPEYKIGTELYFEIVKEFESDGNRYFELKSAFNIPLTVRAHLWQERISTVHCRIVDYRRGRPKLKNIDNNNKQWRVGESHLFDIKGFTTFIDLKGNSFDALIIKFENSNQFTVRAGKWHKKGIWKFENVRCKIVGISREGLPKLAIDDDRHPNYKIGDIRQFEITGFGKKPLPTGGEFSVIFLRDKVGLNYEVGALPNQDKTLSIGTFINCEVLKITTNLNLSQVNAEDPFFVHFDAIIKDSSLRRKYFDNFLNAQDDTSIRLQIQYKQKSAFWVFTYCNQVLNRLKFDYSESKNYNALLDVIEINSIFETWIISSGILLAIKNSEERKVIKEKALGIIESNKLEISAVEALINFVKMNCFLDINNEVDFTALYFYVKHADFRTIDEINLLNIISPYTTILVSTTKKRYAIKLFGIVSQQLLSLDDELRDDHFILSKSRTVVEKDRLVKYINWLFVKVRLSILTDINKDLNLLYAKIFRLSARLHEDLHIKRKLLLNSFYLITNIDEAISLPIYLSNNKVSIKFEQLDENPISNGKLIKKEFYTSSITDKHYKGYHLFVDGSTGFLPYQNITDIELKRNRFLKVNWITNVDITLYSKSFNFFIAKQFSPESINYHSNSLPPNFMHKEGEIVWCIVKDVVNYGVFLSTDYRDGLMHISKISTEPIDEKQLANLFKPGEKIPCKVINSDQRKLELSFVGLIDTPEEDFYYHKIFGIEDSEKPAINLSMIHNDFGYRLELEKGFIFEDFSVTQTSLSQRIKYLKFAKAFYSNTNSARSFLINIYLEYFNSLSKLDVLIENYSFKDYASFKSQIIAIKDKIDETTQIAFPESKNLLFFIEILNLFNSLKDNDLSKLIDLTSSLLDGNEVLLRTVAKNALANNLVISEIHNEEELDSFTLGNLKRIREYINEGILSVKERLEDVFSREMNEKILYWRQVINEDEGEKLEFKATFFTPVPNNDQKRIIANLEEKLITEETELSREKIKKKIVELKTQNSNVTNIEKILIHSALKNVCAFANTNGGHLLLGVSDDKKIFGLEHDYNFFKIANRDEFGKRFDMAIKDYFDDSFSAAILEKEFLKFPEGDILILKIKKSNEPVFLMKNEKGEKDEKLYVRNLSSSVGLGAKQMLKFVREKFPNSI